MEGDFRFRIIKAGKLVLRFVSEDDSGEDEVGGSGRLASMIAVREGLLRGDRRALYLGWLLLAQAPSTNSGIPMPRL